MRSVFLSRPSAVSTEQMSIVRYLEIWLRDRDLRVRTVGVTDFSNKAPLRKIYDVMSECSGCTIIGLKQLHVQSAIEKEGTKSERRRQDFCLPTAWNHIEAGMAFGMQLPLLILKEREVESGVFEFGATEHYVHRITLPIEEWVNSEELRQSLFEWYEDVMRYRSVENDGQRQSK